MGMYLSGVKDPKREWLAANAKEEFFMAPIVEELKNKKRMILAYLDNGHFDCIAVIPDRTELRRVVGGRTDAQMFSCDPAIGVPVSDSPSGLGKHYGVKA